MGVVNEDKKSYNTAIETPLICLVLATLLTRALFMPLPCRPSPTLHRFFALSSRPPSRYLLVPPQSASQHDLNVLQFFAENSQVIFRSSRFVARFIADYVWAKSATLLYIQAWNTPTTHRLVASEPSALHRCLSYRKPRPTPTPSNQHQLHSPRMSPRDALHQ